KVFRTPQQIGNLDAETAATLIATATDVALVLDGSGVIQDVALARTDLASHLAGYRNLIGRDCADTVTTGRPSYVHHLLREAHANKSAGWPQVDPQSIQGIDVPILYATVRLGSDGRVVALGRDLRAIAKLQQQLVEAQVVMERDYSRLRHIETRYRLLF